MKVEFAPSKPQPVLRENIIAQGMTIGWIEMAHASTGGRFHVGLTPQGYISLVQGFGKTKEAAIRNALDKGRAEAEQLLSEIARLEEMLS